MRRYGVEVKIDCVVKIMFISFVYMDWRSSIDESSMLWREGLRWGLKDFRVNVLVQEKRILGYQNGSL